MRGTKFMYLLETIKRMKWNDQMRVCFKQLTKFTYILETDEEEGIG
jgi:hypothetical protein